MNIAVVSGGFDPLHLGHINYLKEASKLGDLLFVCLNSDDWLSKKKGKPFLAFKERKAILESLEFVDKVYKFKDDKYGSCIEGIKQIKKEHPRSKIIFCNGGDRNKTNIPELKLEGITFKFGVGGNQKSNSSSKILNDWNSFQEKRVWGSFKTIFSDNGIKVKELVVLPNSGISYQKHEHRSELWFVFSGKCKLLLKRKGNQRNTKIILNKHDHIIINDGDWHQLINDYPQKCRIVEIQFGKKISEDDITRLFYYN